MTNTENSSLNLASQLNTILARMDSRLFSRLWSFYRDYFQSDNQCLSFIHYCINNEPLTTEQLYIDVMILNDSENRDRNKTLDERVFLPRRMMCTVEQLVTAAQEVGMERKNRDIIKLILLESCAEALQQLKGTSPNKWRMLYSFFNDYISENDKKYITERFTVEYLGDAFFDDNTVDSFKGFINVIYEYRNTALHEGQFDEICFNNWPDHSECPVLSCISMNFKGEIAERKPKKQYIFHSRISYSDFEAIFVRTCIAFIEDYVKSITFVDS